MTTGDELQVLVDTYEVHALEWDTRADEVEHFCEDSDSKLRHAVTSRRKFATG